MRLLYLSLSYVPSRRASSVQVVMMCEAFAAAGHDVTLVTKRGSGDGDLDPFAFYGASPSFELVRVARPSWRGGGIAFLAGMLRQLVERRGNVDLVYSRDLLGGAAAVRLGLPTAFELHGIYDRGWQRAVWRDMVRSDSFRGLVAISAAMVGEVSAAGMSPPVGRPVIVAHSPAAVQVGAEPRAAVGAPPHIGYVGSLYPGRGIELVLHLAGRMPHCQFDIIGGMDADLVRWRTSHPPGNVVFHGFVAPAELSARYRLLDVVVMPYPHQGVHGATRHLDTARYCSPMKMFEYMASGVAMVSSDLPVLQEVLVHERNALIARASDVAAWQAAIDRLLGNPALRVSIARRAQADLAQFTPQVRAERILEAVAPVSDDRRRSGTPQGRSRTG